ncbi:Ger(x)C family spore germination protein [Clostridium taeniosporum]|uniref:Ger(X)C family spore germination protein n=1 Tax=Clostridium taeniosporum TaxID=394958 RepID=A0A1D7XMF9_9CLOT|nr:Ger(x)C family spore germination protein [Clostridium taeniosporum]AOR24512.1 Ger(x)C family spore germination protein [Clostridium taeniosporum]
MKLKKFFIIFLITIMPFSMISCFNYNDVNKLTFVTSIIFDEDENSNVVLYLDCVKAFRNANESVEKGKRLIYKGQGKTALEAIRDVNMAASFKLNFTQNRAYIFTGNAIKNGIKKYIDLINNDPQFPITPNMFVYFDDIDKLLELSSSDEEYLGLFLDDLVEKNENSSKVIKLNTNNYMIERLLPNKLSIMSTLKLKDDACDKKLELGGGAIIQNDRMIGKLDNLNTLSYNMLTNNMESGVLEVSNPNDKKNFITLKILNSKIKTSVDYSDGKFILNKKLKLKTNIAESQSKFITDKNFINNICALEEESIKLNLENTFNEYKEKNIDILQVINLLNQKYGYKKEEDYLSKVEFNVDVEVNIDGSGRNKNSL